MPCLTYIFPMLGVGLGNLVLGFGFSFMKTYNYSRNNPAFEDVMGLD